MKFGICPINTGPLADPHHLSRMARHAEGAGLESLWTFEHAMVPLDYSSPYPYHASGKMPAGPETPFLDPLIALTHAAACTERIKLATGVNILPQANPLLLAKQAASLDVLSGGRMLLGLGVGWLAEEFDAMGVPFGRRGSRADDYLVAMKKVWSGDVVDHQSEFLSWQGFKSYPLPVQRPHPPLIIGGATPAALRRAARHGDGWFAPKGTPQAVAESVAALRREAEAIGRDPDGIEVSLFWLKSSEGASGARAYADAGVSRLVAPLIPKDGDVMGEIDRLADTVIGKV